MRVKKNGSVSSWYRKIERRVMLMSSSGRNLDVHRFKRVAIGNPNFLSAAFTIATKKTLFPPGQCFLLKLIHSIICEIFPIISEKKLFINYLIAPG